MKTIEKYVEQKRTDKAILITVFVDETLRSETFWLPLSKIEITNNTIRIEEEMWKSKLDELQNPTEKIVQVESSVYDKGEKATRIVVHILFRENEEQLFIWLPNSKVINLQVSKDHEGKNTFLVTVPQWLWESAYQNSISKQLEFWNKNEDKYSEQDFKLLSKVIY